MSSSAANPSGYVAPGEGGTWVVPGYTEVRTLGEGGFGKVVLATQDGPGTPVAIKYLHPDLLADQGHVDLFRAEARTLAGLDSPYVVRLFEYVRVPAGAAIVMELVEGVTLAKILERHGKTTPEAALVVLYGSLLGLAAAHAKGVVHRDYKPANVLVNDQGASKLTDFGIAALAGGRPLPSGTLSYMPPEQFEGAAASPAADVYAATVTFYQCLAGRVPFDGRTATELYEQHKAADVPMGPVPERLQPVIARGLAKDPKYRPADAARLAAELRDVAAFGYGADWEDRGRSHLAETAALLLALLWPSGSAPATQGTTVAHTPLTGPPAQPAPSAAGPGQPQAGEARPGHSQPGGSQPSPAARPDAHARHVEHEEHLHAEHVQHAEHAEHVHAEHVRHVQHEEHLAHLGQENEDGERPGRRGKRPRARARVVTVAAVAAAAVVIGVVAAFATSGHSTPPPPPGVASPSGSAALAGAPSPGAAGVASPGITSSGTCFGPGQVANGTAALPVTAASVAASIRQQSSSCYSTPIGQITVTCGHPFTFTSNAVYPEGTISYTCDYSDLSSAATTAYYVNPATGAWVAQS
jgi:hypothetical protein